MSRLPADRDYECWRVNGNIKMPALYCPKGDLEGCMLLDVGDPCPGGKVIAHDYREFLGV